MDIQILSGESLKLKIKKTTLVIDPSSSIPKTDADAVVAFDKSSDVSKVANYRLLINGVGEYEVGGLKITSIKIGSGIMFSFGLENLETALIKASFLSETPSDKIKDYGVVVVNADSEINQSALTAMEPRIIILYGQKANEAAKELGKASLTSTSKVSFSEEKLPEETEIYLLS
ncbi:MAG: hypothetical protein A2171_00090 [Candidatus Levybacteria bacterium RBG_13_35_9]|nr:MAG: hypothetical protein A2171_00090 [Candidatus Levybacteria bacterium RBG_13_35_9]